MFVLRDQTNRQESSVAGQASKLKAKLVGQAEKINKSIDEIMTIDTKDIILLPNAFAEEIVKGFENKQIKWRNRIFPGDVLKLREKLISNLDSMNKDGHTFCELSELYTSMLSYW